MSSLQDRKCSIPGCDSSRRDGARLFRYSKKFLYHKDWLKNCGILPLNSKQLFVCSKHFEPWHFNKRNLKGTAIPTMFLSHSAIIKFSENAAIPNEINSNQILPETAVFQDDYIITILPENRKQIEDLLQEEKMEMGLPMKKNDDMVQTSKSLVLQFVEKIESEVLTWSIPMQLEMVSQMSKLMSDLKKNV